MEINFLDNISTQSKLGKTVLFLVGKDLQIPNSLRNLDREGRLDRILREKGDCFDAKYGHTRIFTLDNFEEGRATKFIAVGVEQDSDCGFEKNNEGQCPNLAMSELGGKLCAIIERMEISDLSVIGEGHSLECICEFLFGLVSRSYKFTKYYKAQLAKQEVKLKVCNVFRSSEAKDLEAKFADYAALLSGIEMTRDLVTEPPCYLYPETFAERCKELKKLGIKVKILDEKDLAKHGMNAHLAVGRGSEKESHLVIMEWSGAKDADEKIAFVGKGITFDTGGINLKPSTNMADMKYDMGGAGVVTGLLKTLALRKAKINAVGVIALAENMPSGSAQRPSDVIVSANGQTIEVDNTDAEGRLVLADALWYTQKYYAPKYLIDLATLTGAIVIALGDGNAGLFSNDDELANKITQASKHSGEGVWRLPLSKWYDNQINSVIADVRNTGQGRGAGSITAAQFLQRFVENGTKWAHIDIAGMAWRNTPAGIIPKGATGFGVHLLDTFVQDLERSK